MDKNIVLIGMPGSGKSTIGYLLSKKLNMRYIDMDEHIELHENKSIKEMFELGEEYFRDVETKCCISLSKLNFHIIAAGGGVIKRQENMTCLKDNSIIIFINRPLDNIIQDIDTYTRPLLSAGKEKLYKLFDERFNLYKKYSDIEILNIAEITETVDQIILLIRKQIENNDN